MLVYISRVLSFLQEALPLTTVLCPGAASTSSRLRYGVDPSAETTE